VTGAQALSLGTGESRGVRSTNTQENLFGVSVTKTAEWVKDTWEELLRKGRRKGRKAYRGVSKTPALKRGGGD